jgi:glycine cleavage system regulatory protein
MTALLVITVIGPDRPGLVESLSETLAEHGANWMESRMSSFAGKFAGILQASVPDANVDALTTALLANQSEGLTVIVETGASSQSTKEVRTVHLELVGQDRPGIVRQISHALARLKINVDELITNHTDASWSMGRRIPPRAPHSW